MNFNNLKIIEDSLDFKSREWFVKRWIPKKYQESILTHCNNVKIACISIIESNIPIIKNPVRFIQMWGYHDYIEWWENPDITPSCWYSDEEKLNIELSSVSDIEDMLGWWWKYLWWILREYILQNTPDSKFLTLLDKLDPGIRCLEYEKLWFWDLINDFEAYILKKLENNEYLLNIYKILLEREFQDINYFYQYFLLLKLWWNKEKFRQEIISRKENFLSKVNEIKQNQNNIFYNNEGTKDMYFKWIKHLSTAWFSWYLDSYTSWRLIKNNNWEVKIKKDIYISDFENIDIKEYKKWDFIKVIDL